MPSKKTADSQQANKRRALIESRIAKLEHKIKKDKELLSKYAKECAQQESTQENSEEKTE
jgi:hypothetical protein